MHEFLKRAKIRDPHGVPSGPVMRAFITSTRVSSTRRKIDESHATGKLVVKIANCMTGKSKTHQQKKKDKPPLQWPMSALECPNLPTFWLRY